MDDSIREQFRAKVVALRSDCEAHFKEVLRTLDDLASSIATGDDGGPPLRHRDDIVREALDRGLDEFLLDVEDRPGTANFNRISSMYMKGGCNVGNSYQANGDYAWCGCFAAWMYRNEIHPEIRNHLFQSTYRLFVYGMNFNDKNLWNHTHMHYRGESVLVSDMLEKFPRLIMFPNFIDSKWSKAWWYGNITKDMKVYSFNIQPGDIVVVGKNSKGCFGNHITVCLDSPRKDYKTGEIIIPTIEGNGVGFGPHSERQEGVVKNNRKISEVQMVIRPSMIDFISFAGAGAYA